MSLIVALGLTLLLDVARLMQDRESTSHNLVDYHDNSRFTLDQITDMLRLLK